MGVRNGQGAALKETSPFRKAFSKLRGKEGEMGVRNRQGAALKETSPFRKAFSKLRVARVRKCAPARAASIRAPPHSRRSSPSRWCPCPAATPAVTPARAPSADPLADTCREERNRNGLVTFPLPSRGMGRR
eukprot:6206771-Pleurochrysis_carterae.AAC.3